MEYFIVLVSVFIYFLPTIAARNKSVSNSVLIINLFLGWTLIGWVVALAMAVNPEKV
jgi:hypothetical protein